MSCGDETKFAEQLAADDSGLRFSVVLGPAARSARARSLGKMKSLVPISILLLLCGCRSSDARFQGEMKRYEETCDRYFATYASSDIDGAKKALGQIIDLSLDERRKATLYWRFNLQIAYSQARLAVIAEHQGKKEEVDRLFASASEFNVIQNQAFNQELRRTHVQFKQYSDDEARFTPDRWRTNVAALDKKFSVRWNQPNQHLQATPR